MKFGSRLALVVFFAALFSLLFGRCGSVNVADLDPNEFSDTDTGTVVDCTTVASAFTADVVPIFADQGCAATDCHGTTKSGGLSLDVATDGAADVYASASDPSRVNTTTPSSSLLLRKPVGAVTHGGGKVFSGVKDPDYMTISCWISAGALNN